MLREHILRSLEWPLRPTVSSDQNNLPAKLDSFIGRERELGEIRELLQAHQLVTLTGVRGAGKTRLSLRVARLERDRFADGVWLAGNDPVPGTGPGAPIVSDVALNNSIITFGPFTSPGAYHIYCTLHPGMTLTILVQ
jgi:hypothetical protein